MYKVSIHLRVHLRVLFAMLPISLCEITSLTCIPGIKYAYISLFLDIQGVHHLFVGFHQEIVLEKDIDSYFCTYHFTKLQKLLVRPLRSHNNMVWLNLCYIMKRWTIIPCYKLIQSNYLTTTKHRMASEMEWQLQIYN